MAAPSQYHFGIEGSVLTGPRGGNSVKHNLEQILTHLRPEKWGARFTCYTRASDVPLSDLLTEVPVTWKQPAGTKFVWRHLALPTMARRSDLDLLWFPFHTIPFITGVPSVVSVHDVSFVALPHLFDSRTKLYLGAMLKRTLAQASHIITISQFTADELTSRFRVPADRMTVVHHGISENLVAPSAGVSAAVLSRLRLDRPYFLLLDGANPRKNLSLLLEVLKTEPNGLPEIQFVVTGPMERIEPILDAAGLGKEPRAQFVLPGVLTVDELDILYRQARAVLYLSEYEGFGLPILEAFARGCPVVALRASCLPEIAGSAAVYVDPGNTSQLHEALKLLLRDDARSELASLGAVEGQRFSWSRAADHVSETLVRVAKKL